MFRLAEAFSLPETYTGIQRTKATGMEALMVMSKPTKSLLKIKYTQDKDKKRSNAEKTRTKIGQENKIRTARNKDKEKKKKKHKLQRH